MKKLNFFPLFAGTNLKNPESYPSTHQAILLKNGVKWKDELQIRPIEGKSKKIELHRTHYLFTSVYNEERSHEIFLPSLGSQKIDFEIMFDQFGEGATEGAYYMCSKGKDPFRINGNLSYCSYLERGDRVELGFNQLHFQAPVAQNQMETIFSSKVSIDLIHSTLPVLIEGETGTGKSTMAKEIHQRSQRPGRFVHLNLSSFSRNLLESELFGHVKGAFTGASHDKTGAFLEANDGTLFLDELDSLELDLQTKLLLFLDNQELRPVGSGKTYKSRARLIFASGRNLSDLVNQGLFRRDLLYRLKAGGVCQLLPLRQDFEKIQSIIEYWCHQEESAISQQLLSFYQNCSWPGNARQLISHLNLKKVLSKGKKLVLEEMDLKLNEDFVPSEIYQHKTMNNVKSAYAKQVFYQLKEDVTLAAKYLKISPATLKKFVNHQGCL
jgi:DNA-binding NtrC family response regulator